jgi:hypothetical protein
MIGGQGASPRVVGAIDSNVQYVEPGLLVFVMDGTLVKQRFDPAAGTLVGAPTPVVESVKFFLSTGLAAFATSLDGTLVYQPQRDRDRLAWVDRSGREIAPVGTPGEYLDIRLVKGGHEALATRALPATGTFDIWSLNLDRGGETRVTLNDRTTEIAPLMPDDRTLIYAGTMGGPPQLVRRNLETGVDAELLPRSPRFRQGYALTPDGASLVYGERSRTGEQLWFWPLAGTSPPRPLMSASSEARISPDGRYYTFVALESGRQEVFVAPLTGGGKQAVSDGGGSEARWGPDGREILYLSSDSRLVSVPVRTSPALRLDKSETLFVVNGKGWVDFDIAPDGKRLLAIIKEVSAAEEPLRAKLHVLGGLPAR